MWIPQPDAAVRFASRTAVATYRARPARPGRSVARALVWRTNAIAVIPVDHATATKIVACRLPHAAPTACASALGRKSLAAAASSVVLEGAATRLADRPLARASSKGRTAATMETTAARKFVKAASARASTRSLPVRAAMSAAATPHACCLQGPIRATMSASAAILKPPASPLRRATSHCCVSPRQGYRSIRRAPAIRQRFFHCAERAACRNAAATSGRWRAPRPHSDRFVLRSPTAERYCSGRPASIQSTSRCRAISSGMAPLPTGNWPGGGKPVHSGRLTGVTPQRITAASASTPA